MPHPPEAPAGFSVCIPLIQLSLSLVFLLIPNLIPGNEIQITQNDVNLARDFSLQVIL